MANFCTNGGYLVSGKKALPEDKSEYQAEMRYPTVGCTRLECERCGAEVRSQRGLNAMSVEQARDLAALYATADWSTLPRMEPAPEYRLYACRCSYHEVDSDEPLIQDDSNPSPWRCTGHPAAELPVTVHGIEVTRFSDIERVVRDNVASDNILLALRERLAGTPLQAKIGEIATRLLSDPDPRIKVLAFGMYWQYPDADGARRIVELASGDRAGFIGVTDPKSTSKLDLEGRLVRSLGKLLASGFVAADDALAILRRDAVKRSTSRAALPVLLAHDAAWVRDHADEIVASAPNAVGALVAGLSHGSGGSVDLEKLARKATGLSSEEKAIVRKEIQHGASLGSSASLLDIFAK